MRAFLLVAACLLSAGTAAAQTGPDPYLQQARVYYQGMEFEKCIARLEQAARWKNTPQELVEIELYNGLCKYNLGKSRDAEDHFQVALQLDREAKLPPYTSPKIEALYKKVKDRLPKPPPEKAEVAKAEEPKAQDAPVKTDLLPRPEEKPSSQVDFTEAAPKKSYAVPLALGGAAVVAAGVGGYLGMRAKQLETSANAAHFESDAIAQGNQAKQNALFANVGFGVAGAAATAALLTWALSGD